MYFAAHDDLEVDRSNPHFIARHFVNRAMGATSLTVREVIVEPGKSVPLHLHRECEEAMIMLEGIVEATMGDETRTMGPGITALAPAGVKHAMVNKSDETVRILAIFPSANPTRTFL